MADTRQQSAKGVFLFPLFERFWHWSQAMLIIGLMVTGAEIRGYWAFVGFEKALNLHIIGAFSLIVLWTFAIFWHVVTGQWRHYVLTTKGLWKVVLFYASGIFLGSPHPFRPSPKRKHNPMQAMAYLTFHLLMAPAIWISGVILWIYGRYPALYPDAVPVIWINGVHVAAAFLIGAFLVAHLYLITTGETVFAQLRAMITGWDNFGKVEED
ncbi:cytochrome b/b6 domain-containing protein [Tropicimonas marinistellae]|uniref:cytochrome b/b6 domain-containing protein n=1 Tax=Tropicimonas marinistellae TaxID=1739787 RepID=UPI000829A00A|nr:cytochrome b/b6 domain-containing protein [Tropicimonas marinistellae]